VDALVVWSMVYPHLAASYYGKDGTALLAPQAHAPRSGDLNFISAMLRRGFSIGHASPKLERGGGYLTCDLLVSCTVSCTVSEHSK
jgi:hypothetical protein